MVLPKGEGKLLPVGKFFAARTVNKRGTHLRAFASEVITAISVLAVFVDRILKPSGHLPRYVEWFETLRHIVEILALGDRAVGLVDMLQRKVDEHHILFLELFRECAKFKLHGLQHIVESIRKFQRNLNCFATERRHRGTKRLAAFTYKKLTKHLIIRDIDKLMKLFKDPRCFQSSCLKNPVTKGTECMMFVGVTNHWSSASMSTDRGSFHKKDAVMWCVNAVFQVGLVCRFVQVVAVDQSVTFVAIVSKLHHIDGQVWSKRDPTSCVVPARDLLRKVPYLDQGDSLWIVLPCVI